MLDANLKTQLQAYLGNLRQPIRLIASLDDGASSAELRELLQEIAGLSDKVSYDESGSDSRGLAHIKTKQSPKRMVDLSTDGIPNSSKTI